MVCTPLVMYAATVRESEKVMPEILPSRFFLTWLSEVLNDEEFPG